jgi:protein arginine kinase activator
MLCQHCHQSEATVKITKVDNGQVQHMNFCEECAHKLREIYQKHSGLPDFLQAFFAQKGLEADTQQLKCPVCGRTFAEIQESGRVGCSQCYETFEPQMVVLLRRLHGGSRHVGKAPVRGASGLRREKEVRGLKAKLNELVRQEAFEDAAVLRDQIRALETEGGVL